MARTGPPPSSTRPEEAGLIESARATGTSESRNTFGSARTPPPIHRVEVSKRRSTITLSSGTVPTITLATPVRRVTINKTAPQALGDDHERYGVPQEGEQDRSRVKPSRTERRRSLTRGSLSRPDVLPCGGALDGGLPRRLPQRRVGEADPKGYGCACYRTETCPSGPSGSLPLMLSLPEPPSSASGKKDGAMRRGVSSIPSATQRRRVPTEPGTQEHRRWRCRSRR